MTTTDTEQNKIPTHLAIIPDGNRRWAKQKGLPAFEGHRKGAQNFEEILTHSRNLGIKYFSSWAFSTENWKRSDEEKEYLFNIAREFTKKYYQKFLAEKARFLHLGRKDRLPADIVETLLSMENDTKDFTEFTVCIGMDYGGLDEVERAILKTQSDKSNPTIDNIKRNLDTRGIVPDVDLLIRTGGEQRTSGFMPLLTTYAEFYFTPLFYPDFNSEQLDKAITEYSLRQRRFGGDGSVAK